MSQTEKSKHHKYTFNLWEKCAYTSLVWTRGSGAYLIVVTGSACEKSQFGKFCYNLCFFADFLGVHGLVDGWNTASGGQFHIQLWSHFVAGTGGINKGMWGITRAAVIEGVMGGKGGGGALCFSNWSVIISPPPPPSLAPRIPTIANH